MTIAPGTRCEWPGCSVVHAPPSSQLTRHHYPPRSRGWKPGDAIYLLCRPHHDRADREPGAFGPPLSSRWERQRMFIDWTEIGRIRRESPVYLAVEEDDWEADQDDLFDRMDRGDFDDLRSWEFEEV